MDDSVEGPLDFDSISDYIIPKPELCGRLVTIFLNAKFKVVGFPVLLEGPKYERNNLLFNLCFIFERGSPTGAYDQVIRKIARELTNLEVCCADSVINATDYPMYTARERSHPQSKV